MTSTEATYRIEERKPANGVIVPMVDVYVSQENIPFNRDWSNRKCTMTAFFPSHIERTLNFKGRPDDVWVVTVPKCGTTWMQETAWLIYNDFDFETAKNTPLMDRSPFVE
uniref:Sulfotransferase domain-containing protein n=1 Tax=Megaselia scalaris TaxID=36166 RepID=T1GHG5_MEGSC